MSRLRRLGIAIASSAVAAIGIVLFLSMNATFNAFQKDHARVRELGFVAQIAEEQANPADREAIRRMIAHDYRDVIEDPAEWGAWGTLHDDSSAYEGVRQRGGGGVLGSGGA